MGKRRGSRNKKLHEQGIKIVRKNIRKSGGRKIGKETYDMTKAVKKEKAKKKKEESDD
jgi:chemotaxis receptor (MCP) glutamine deamidase CheD